MDPMAAVGAELHFTIIVKDSKYKVVGIDQEYTGDRGGHDQKVVINQLCVRHHVLVYHYCMATMTYKCFARFVNNPDHRFAKIDTTNDLKVIKTSGLSCQKHVNIQGEYKVWGSDNKKQKDSLFNVIAGIIDPYYGDMKADCDKDKFVWHKA
ncbi:hypothetical protein D1007_39600 [Hordeum vulgare]|nr:hypothetical protein D1007_39600 [Hordeum vulgare]